MRREKHIKLLIELLEDIRKEPSISVVGFIYSTTLAHMFHLAFYDELESGRAIKHQNFGSKEKSQILKNLIRDFQDKEEMFSIWKEMENKRNVICYSYPDDIDIDYYTNRYFKIKSILEKISGISFEIKDLMEMIKNEQTY